MSPHKKYSHDYIMSKRAKGILVMNGYELICRRCGLPIKIGQSVHSRAQRSKPASCVRKGKKVKRTKLYHEACWNAMFIDLPDEPNG